MAKRNPKKKTSGGKKTPKKKTSGEKSIGTHLEQNAKMSHKDFPEFLKANFEEAGEKINQ
jgi:hypothetical protein